MGNGVMFNTSDYIAGRHLPFLIPEITSFTMTALYNDNTLQ